MFRSSQETAGTTTTVPTKILNGLDQMMDVFESTKNLGFKVMPVGIMLIFMYSDGTNKNAISVKSISAEGKDFTTFAGQF